VVGVNSITVYLASDYIAILLDMWPVKTADGQIPAKQWIYENVFAGIEPVKVATLAFALTLMALLWAMAWGMERMGWRVRV
jgi:predicted acyltransferase